MSVHNNSHLQTRSFRVVINRTEEDDGYIATIPSLEYCMAFGNIVEEAMQNLKEALDGTLEVMLEDGVEIPDDANSIESMISVSLPWLRVFHP